ncbi:MAG: hypothetical protein AAGA90_23570 [Actinomycetota bacterium]
MSFRARQIDEALRNLNTKSGHGGRSPAVAETVLWSPLHHRHSIPRSGDIVRWYDDRAPFADRPRGWRNGRISDHHNRGLLEPGQIMICEELGSAFLRDDGTVDISGGPFRTIQADQLLATWQTYPAPVWNWAGASRGKDRGHHFTIDRPVFIYDPRDSSTESDEVS